MSACNLSTPTATSPPATACWRRWRIPEWHVSYATNEGVRVHYEIVGKGEPLVLQHGYSQDSGEWREFGYVAPLSERYRVVLVDMRGHGRSDKPHDGEAYALKNLVGDVVAVLADAGIQRAHYWGYSMGDG